MASEESMYNKIMKDFRKESAKLGFKYKKVGDISYKRYQRKVYPYIKLEKPIMMEDGKRLS